VNYLRPAAIIFDFDLTLVNSLEGFVECHAVAARAVGFTPPDWPTISRTIGTPLPDVFRLLYGYDKEEVLDVWLRAYQARADEVMTGLTVFLDGAEEAIQRLYAAGIPLGIVSQKLRYRVEDVLHRAGLLDRFAVLIGGDDVTALKPDPRGLLMAIEKLGAMLTTSLYVGDTGIDAETAFRAGVPFIAVMTGYATPDEFDPFKPVARIESVASLPDFLGVSESTADRERISG
jgi:phosphoglycolate phosphatase